MLCLPYAGFFLDKFALLLPCQNILVIPFFCYQTQSYQQLTSWFGAIQQYSSCIKCLMRKFCHQYWKICFLTEASLASFKIQGSFLTQWVGGELYWMVHLLCLTASVGSVWKMMLRVMGMRLAKRQTPNDSKMDRPWLSDDVQLDGESPIQAGGLRLLRGGGVTVTHFIIHQWDVSFTQMNNCHCKIGTWKRTK